MKLLILASCVCMALAAPAGSDSEATIIHNDADVTAEGFSYSYQTSNNIEAQATGSVKQIGADNKAGIVIKGSYQYVGADGIPVQFTYVADENGYQPQSDLLPVSPAVPEAIQASLKYIAEHPYTEPKL